MYPYGSLHICFILKRGRGRNLAIFLRYDDNDDFVTSLYQCQMKITRSIHRLMRLMQIDAITACYLVIFLPSYGPIHIDYRHNPPPLRYNSLKLSRYVPEFPRVFPRITAFFFRWERSLFYLRSIGVRTLWLQFIALPSITCPSTGEMMIRICSIYGKMRNMKNVSADHIGKFRYVPRKRT